MYQVEVAIHVANMHQMEGAYITMELLILDCMTNASAYMRQSGRS